MKSYLLFHRCQHRNLPIELEHYTVFHNHILGTLMMINEQLWLNIMWCGWQQTSLIAPMSWNVFRSISASNHNHYYFGKERKIQITVEKPAENTLFHVYGTQFPVIWSEVKKNHISWPKVLEIKIGKYYFIKITWTQYKILPNIKLSIILLTNNRWVLLNTAYINNFSH